MTLWIICSALVLIAVVWRLRRAAAQLDTILAEERDAAGRDAAGRDAVTATAPWPVAEPAWVVAPRAATRPAPARVPAVIAEPIAWPHPPRRARALTRSDRMAG